MGYEKDPVRREALLRQLAEGTRAAARQGARLVVWPEGSLDFDPTVRRTAEIAALARETGAYLVIGYMVDVPGAAWRNEAVTVDPSGAFLAAYGKDHPVVFGGERGTSLHTYPVHEAPFGRFGTIICYDLDFTDTARKIARAGAGIVAVPSLDWPAIAGRHSAHLVLRAVENHAAMIKADGGYDSLVVDARGRVLAKTVTPRGRDRPARGRRGARGRRRRGDPSRRLDRLAVPGWLRVLRGVQAGRGAPRAARSAYPFTAPRVSPRTTYFWKIIVRMIAGMTMATAAAMTAPQSTSAYETKL